jgi:hypothetical protein
MFYEDIFREFNKQKINYLVIGRLAVNLHGIPRMTQDLDLFAATELISVARIYILFGFYLFWRYNY